MLKRQGVIDTWHDRRIGAGEEIHPAIDDHINTDQIVLLLISADFLASKYCYDIEMRRAMERHEEREAIVIPVILRACDWHHAPFGKLKAVPLNGKPVTQWADIDDAFLQVAKAVREATARIGGAAKSPLRGVGTGSTTAPAPSAPAVGPRSTR